MKMSVKITFYLACCLALGATGYGAYSVVSDLGDEPWDHLQHTKLTASDQPPASDEAEHAAASFLATWGRGDIENAASMTDDPMPAFRSMLQYRDVLSVSKLRFTPIAKPTVIARDSPPAASIPVGYRATAQIRGDHMWSYAGFVSVIKATNGRIAVHWDSSVLHPRLTKGGHLEVGALPPASPVVTDSTGTPITTYPSLKPLASGIAKPDDPRFRGTLGRGVIIRGTAGENAPVVVHTFTASKPAPPLRLTIDRRYQKAAERAVALQGKNGKRVASLVAIEPSTGHVLALANSRPFNAAFSGLTAPGSTMKIITAAALMEHGVFPDTPAPCPAHLVVDGKEFHNVEGTSNPAATLRDDFAASCNTGFIGLRGKLDADDLTAEAREVFGIGQEWHTGLANADGKVPAPGTDVDKAASMIGQGSIQMNPLAMASVAATVQAGVFHQPVLRTDVIQQPAARALSPLLDARLKDLMHTTAVRGTAAQVMANLDGGAKTGTAEVGTAADSWFTAYAGGVAAAAMVEGGGHGADAAGPAVRTVLTAGRP
ncbi:penicillin-binding transpeptidase domain-containing protein [Streptomyces sp. NPDC008238]